eukprot:2772106-Rhodomonas_salina.1
MTDPITESEIGDTPAPSLDTQISYADLPVHPSLFRVWDDYAHLLLGYLDPTRLTLPRHGLVEDQCTGCHKCLGHGHLTA